MNIAIFFDAEAVAGDAELLHARQAGSDRSVARRAGAARAFRSRGRERFRTPIGFFNNLVTSKSEGEALDLKKGGVFPIVHGVRALALEKGLDRDRHSGAHRPAIASWECSNASSRAN